MGTMEILEINQKQLSLLDLKQIQAFIDIFRAVSNPKAKKIVKDLSRELRGRKNEEVSEASIKDILKSVKASAKKIGGIIDKVMDDKEFQDAYAKYVDNPKDKDRLKKIQAYTNGLLGDMTESFTLKKARLEKICSIILGENFCPDFIYEDIDFTKPSAIKEAYEVFEANGDWVIYNKKTGKRLSPSKSWRKWQGAKAAASKIGGDAEVADAAWYQDNKAKLMGEATDLEEAIKVKTHRGMYSMKKGEESLRNWVDGIVIMSDAVKKNQRKTVAQNIVKAIETGKIKNADLTQDLGTLIGVKAPSGMEAPKSVVKDRMKELNLLESTDKELDIKSLKDLIKNPSPKMVKQYGGKDKYIKMLKSKLAKLESVDLEEAIKWWTVTITKKTGKLFKGQTVDVKASNSAQAIKKGLKQMKADPTTVPSGSVDAVLGESKDMDFEKTNVLTYDEYDEVKNFQNFNKKDWKRNAIQRKYIRKKKV